MNPEVMANFMEALGIMGKGMLGIFVVICTVGIIIVGYFFNAIQYLLV